MGKFIQRERLHDALFYDYWLVNSTLALSLLRRRGVIQRVVARAHGFDVYDEQQELGAVPYRAFVVSSVDRVFTVSAGGRAYLAERHPEAREKLVLSRLGIDARRPDRGRVVGTEPLIVSCGSMSSVKRIELIPKVLAAIDRPLRWVHFGDGPERDAVERAAARLPGRVSWQLRGHTNHKELIDFYAKNKVDLFISLSRSEGIPVSIMEAISFGTPILATQVGGVPEIVTPRTGVLVGIDEPDESIARDARRLLDGYGPSSDEIMAFFNENFDATKNFNEFADMLVDL